MRATDRHWNKFGEVDPYFAVVTADEFKADKIANNRERFFASGEEFISEILREMEIANISPDKLKFALDFGCGVGRLTIPLASRFEAVVGVDISTAMISEAERNFESGKLTNYRFENDLFCVETRPDFVNSYIVLQHIPVGRGYLIIRQLCRILNPGGSIMIHISLRRRLSPLKAAAYFIKHSVPWGWRLMNVLQGRPLNSPVMQMNEYDLVTVLDIFRRYGMSKVQLNHEEHAGTFTVRILAKKLAETEDGSVL
jgi:2-polyprenyl-3-methyl-5-hydroxy-6-metoxy-1,4-benzoquinol methylase